MSKVQLVSVTFVASASPYHKGDVAGFPAEEAEQYVAAGVADYTPKPRAQQRAKAAAADTAAETGELPLEQAAEQAEAFEQAAGQGETPGSPDAAVGE